MAAIDILLKFCFPCGNEEKQYVGKEMCGYLNRLICGKLGVNLQQIFYMPTTDNRLYAFFRYQK